MDDKYVGKRLDGRYEIHELIGTGGMAYVYKAFDNQEQRFVAIKILKEEFSKNEEFLRRFRNESRAVSMLSHDNIVKVYDVSFGDRMQYIVMEYISGITLKDHITRKGALPWKDTVYFTMQILSALEHAHKNGVVHRDIKPQNIILLEDGKIKVTDFGIARFAQSGTQTMTDKALGSVHYIAPEQAKGEFTSDKVDIYSLGVMMYEMLTGQLPFEADSAVSVAIMQLQAKPLKPRSINPEIPLALEEITMKAMEKNPGMRFRNASEMIRDFETFKNHPDVIFSYNCANDLENTKQMDIIDISSNAQKNQQSEYQDNFEYEEELVRSKKFSTGSMLVTGIVVALIVVILSITGFMVVEYLRNPPVTESNEVMLPTFVGMNYYSEIEDNSEYEDLKFILDEVENEAYEVGEVLKQSPNGGLMVKKGKEIILQVAVAPPPPQELMVPSVDGDTQADAFNKLVKAGFVPIIENINSNVDANYAVRTSPAGGENAPEGSEVILYISKGPAILQVTVPSLVGLSLGDAEKILRNSKLYLGEVNYDKDSDKPKDEVLKVHAEENERLPEGSKVSVTVSAGYKTPKSVDIAIELPTGVDMDISAKFYVEGILVENKVINPSLSGYYKTTVVGLNGKQDVTLKLNDNDYVYGVIDYDEGKGIFTVTSTNPFVPPTPSTDVLGFRR